MSEIAAVREERGEELLGSVVTGVAWDEGHVCLTSASSRGLQLLEENGVEVKLFNLDPH